MKGIKLIILLLGSCIFANAQNPIEIQPSETRHGPEKGSLIIIGGGIVTDEIWDEFVKLAGGKDKARIAVVVNGSGDTTVDHSRTLDSIKKRVEDKNISVFYHKTIREANDEKNLEVLKQSTGIYFVGGRQWRIADAYLNTPAHQEFLNVLSRGGVIAGSSAGASIQGSFLWRGDTSGPDVLIGDHTQGLGFLRNSVIDQHLLPRNRQFDLVDFIKIAPQFIGIGLDESTAIVVKRDELEVIGKSVVAIYDNGSKPFFFLSKGQKYDLKEHKVIRPPGPEN